MIIPYGLNRLTDRRGLIEFLGIPESLFDSVLDFVPPALGPDGVSQLEQSSLGTLPPFLRHQIPKRNADRGHRTVWEPMYSMPYYKALARRLDVFLSALLKGYPHDCAFGYRPRRNILENAAAHSGRRYLLRTDIRSFFPSISTSSVQTLFESLNVKANIAESLARFVTIEGSLPLGLPTSPVISNAVALPMDHLLAELAGRVGATYSRYSDDLSFSSDGVLPDIAEIAAAVRANGFDLAQEKTRHSTRGQAHFVTGLSVADSDRPHVPRIRKRKLRQELYYAKKFGLAEHFERSGAILGSSFQQQVNRLDGTVKFVAYHEPRHASILNGSWKDILSTNYARPSFVPRNQHQAPYWIFVDEAEFKQGNQRLLALCMVATQHPEHVMGATEEVLVRLLNDLWADGDINNLSRGLHYAEATQDQRLEYIKRLAALPVAAYVSFVAIDGAGYEAAYLRVLETMLPRRLMGAESKFAELVFEKNNKVSQPAVIRAVNAAHGELERNNNRRPLAVHCSFASKPHMGITTADFFLGVLGTYLKSSPPAFGRPETRDRLLFDRLRDRFRVIANLNTGEEFTRRTPISPWQEAQASNGTIATQ